MKKKKIEALLPVNNFKPKGEKLPKPSAPIDESFFEIIPLRPSSG